MSWFLQLLLTYFTESKITMSTEPGDTKEADHSLEQCDVEDLEHPVANKNTMEAEMIHTNIEPIALNDVEDTTLMNEVDNDCMIISVEQQQHSCETETASNADSHSSSSISRHSNNTHSSHCDTTTSVIGGVRDGASCVDGLGDSSVVGDKADSVAGDGADNVIGDAVSVKSEGSESIRSTSGRNSHSREVSDMGSGGERRLSESLATSIDLEGLDVLRFRNNFLQTVEELKMRRNADTKNENRIEKLVQEKHQLQQKYDECESNHMEHLKQCSQHEQEIRKQYTSQLRQLEEEKARFECLDESRQKEMKAFKDEIRALQLSRYNLEKKVEDQERQLQVQTLSRESVLNEMSGVETKYQTVINQVASTTEQMTLLEANVKQAIEMNKKLQYVNDHQQCILTDYKTELEMCRQELVDARVSLANSLTEREERGGHAEKVAAARELKMNAELNKQLQVQLSSVRDEHQTVLSRLKEAHALLDKHIETSNKAQENEHNLQMKTELLLDQKQSLERELTDLTNQLTSQRQELTAEIEQWKAKTVDIEKRLKNLQEDYSELQNTHDRSERARENRESELKSEMDRLLAENEKWHQEKIEGEVQVRKLEDRVAEMEKSLNEPKISQNITSEGKGMAAVDPEVSTKSKDELDAQDVTPLTVAIKPQSPTCDSISNSVKSVMTAENHEQSPTNSSEKTAGSAMVESTSGCNDDGNTVPNLAKSSPILSPEVISDSNTTSASETTVKELPLRLSSPRLHLERLQLPLKKENECSDQSLKDPLELQDSSSLKRKLDQQQETSSTISPSKKQKYPPKPSPQQFDKRNALQRATTSVLPPSESSFLLDAHSKLEQHSESSPYQLPLSQPSHSNTTDGVDDREKQSLSQSSLDSRYAKRNISWRIDLPESFYASRKQPPNRDNVKTTPPKELLVRPKSSFPQHVSPSMAPPPLYQLPWKRKSTSPTNNQAVMTVSDRSSAASITPSQKIITVKTECPSAAPRKIIQPISNFPSANESVPDQSVPNSPGGSSNFSIVFSEGEDEDEGGNKDEMISSQMNRQIKKVTSFLKMDRLRRTKVRKL